ncbi:MAG: hypothetical protein ACK4UO_18310 [Pseudolabrys sp.]
MTTGDDYRAKAATLRARAQREADPAIAADFENLALAYLRLAEQADRNKSFEAGGRPPARPHTDEEP